MLAGNYRWYEPYGFGPTAEDVAFLEHELGGDAPVDMGLQGGETLRLGPSWRVEVLALPGHTPGHLGLWDPRSGAAIIIDAALADGVYDRAGNRLIPPRYYTAAGYEATIRRLRALDPALLLTAHYPVMERDEARAFLDRSLAFVQAVRDAVRAGVERARPSCGRSPRRWTRRSARSRPSRTSSPRPCARISPRSEAGTPRGTPARLIARAGPRWNASPQYGAPDPRGDPADAQSVQGPDRHRHPRLGRRTGSRTRSRRRRRARRTCSTSCSTTSASRRWSRGAASSRRPT